MTSEIFPKDRGEAIKEHDIIADETALHYALYMRTPSAGDREYYSVEITCVFENESETAFAYDISSLRGSAEAIFDTLCRATVTPCTLYDVLEELL